MVLNLKKKKTVEKDFYSDKSDKNYKHKKSNTVSLIP